MGDRRGWARKSRRERRKRKLALEEGRGRD
jgi:hypothetical protein